MCAGHSSSAAAVMATRAMATGGMIAARAATPIRMVIAADSVPTARARVMASLVRPTDNAREVDAVAAGTSHPDRRRTKFS